MKRYSILAVAMLLSVAIASAADETTEKALELKGATARPNYVMLLGSVSKVETADPSKVTVEVQNERDGQIHTVEIAPATNVTKVTDISELKAGDSIRIMAKKIDNREIAVGIMFGNLKKFSPQKLPAAQAVSDISTTGAAAKETPKE